MTIKKAIKVLEQAKAEAPNNIDVWYSSFEYQEAFTLAIQALNHMKIVHKQK